MQTRVSYSWDEPDVAMGYGTGVSLHSHTSASEESLSFIHKMGTEFPLITPLFRRYESICKARYGVTLDFERGCWRPPLLPAMAYELEQKQITDLGLRALISISDHDTIEAPMLLRTLPVARGIPVSVEWTAPFGATVFHLGVHNLPTDDAAVWMERLKGFTASPSDEELLEMVRELDAIPQVLVVMNHPLWDLYKTGKVHAAELERFLLLAGDAVHALELNGLRHAKENREVVGMAKRLGRLLISGGDRHGLEANANLNLTHAKNFNEFVHEIRVKRVSHVLFMEQYRRPWEQRITDSTIDAVTDFPQFSPGWQRWDERAFHPDADGVMRPMSELWVKGRAPRMLLFAIGVVRVMRYGSVSRLLSLAFPGVNSAKEMVRDLA